jgi:poly(A) polymerase
MRFMDVTAMRRSTLRTMVSAPEFPVELELHRLDCLASHGDLSNYRFLLDYRQQLADEPTLPAPWVTGHDIMALGVSEGPEVGQWHRKAYEAQLEERFQTREDILAWLRECIEAGMTTEEDGE